ncbi:MAG TPA: hypothetical protein VJG31_03445 [Candidatus Nanoarchaeia archaeon]|nr:hypothetical protein [Candidatus Nanoarchaeia archaeon]
MVKTMAKQLFPQEIEVWYILPAVRKALAEEMMARSMPQTEIALLLGTSEATISHYRQEKRAKKEIFNLTIKKEVKKAVGRIQKNSTLLFDEVIKLCRLARKERIICQVHHQKNKLPKNCSCEWIK